jgi:hypothetical protein
MSESAANTPHTLDPAFVRAQLTGWTPRGVFYQPDESIPWMSGGAGAFFAMSGSNDTVRLFLTGRDKTIRTRIGIVTLQWSKTPEVLDVAREPVFDLGALGNFDMDGVSYPWIVETGGALFMYYVGWNRLGGEIPFRNQIGLAVSEDGGKNFRRVTRAPLLPLTDSEPIGSGSCCVEQVPGGWRLYYTNFLRWERRPDGPRHYYHVREAFSKDGVHWERPGKVVIDLVPPDEYALGAPDLDLSNDRRVLHFTARGLRYRLFASVEASDGAWMRLPGHIEIPRGAFDSDMQCYPRTFKFRGTTYLLYSGNGYGRAGIGYAEWTGI